MSLASGAERRAAKTRSPIRAPAPDPSQVQIPAGLRQQVCAELLSPFGLRILVHAEHKSVRVTGLETESTLERRGQLRALQG